MVFECVTNFSIELNKKKNFFFFYSQLMRNFHTLLATHSRIKTEPNTTKKFYTNLITPKSVVLLLRRNLYIHFVYIKEVRRRRRNEMKWKKKTREKYHRIQRHIFDYTHTPLSMLVVVAEDAAVRRGITFRLYVYMHRCCR